MSDLDWPIVYFSHVWTEYEVVEFQGEVFEFDEFSEDGTPRDEQEVDDAECDAE